MSDCADHGCNERDNEVREQARLLGMSGSREAKLMAEIEALKRVAKAAKAYIYKCGISADEMQVLHDAISVLPHGLLDEK